MSCNPWWRHIIETTFAWASYQIRKIAGCACARNAGNVFPHCRFQRKPLVSDPGMHHGTCVTHVPWCMSGSLTCGDGENVPGIPGACAPAILRIWQEAHYGPFVRGIRRWPTDFPYTGSMIGTSDIFFVATAKKLLDQQWSSGPRLNIKTVLSTYGNFHVKDKTAVRTSYL